MKIMIEVNQLICRRCLQGWHSKLDRPKQCPFCHSPYWDKDRKRAGDKGANTKYGFDQIQIGEWSRFPWYKNADGSWDTYRNKKRANTLNHYMWRHGYHYSTSSEPGFLLVTRRNPSPV